MNIAEATRSRLVGAIGTMTPTDFSKDPGKHFIRNRKLPFQALIFGLQRPVLGKKGLDPVQEARGVGFQE